MIYTSLLTPQTSWESKSVMRINFYADNFIEQWSYRNVTDIGIGGSETSQVEMALRLAARGHDVTSYGPLPTGEKCKACDGEGVFDPEDDCDTCAVCDGVGSAIATPDCEFGGVHWRHFKTADVTEAGLWIVYRNPTTAARCLSHICKARQKWWMVAQDVFYPNWNSRDVAYFDRVIGLCPRHCFDICSRDKANASKVMLSGNGINVERIEDIERQVCQEHPRDFKHGRNPKRLIWASSPDRGLKECLDIFERAREQVPDLELHCFYGMDNIDKICGGDRRKMPWRLSWDQYDRACAMPGVTWRGRVGQKQLTREWLLSGLWLYPTWFAETSCISCMEAQACGCIPITNPIWGTGHNVKHGIFIEGDQSDPLVKARYVDAVVRVASNPERQELIRASMMPEARERLDWERIADQWEAWIGTDFFQANPQEERAACC